VRVASHLACLGLEPDDDGSAFDRLMEALLRSGTARGLEDGWTGVTFTDPSGARVVFGVHPDGSVPVLQPSFAGARRQPFLLTRAPVAPSALALGELTTSGTGLALDLADPLALGVQGEAAGDIALTLLAESVGPAAADEPDTLAAVGLLAVGAAPGAEPEPVALAVGVVQRAAPRRTVATAQAWVHVELRTPMGVVDVCCSAVELDPLPASGDRLRVEAYVVGAL